MAESQQPPRSRPGAPQAEDRQASQPPQGRQPPQASEGPVAGSPTNGPSAAAQQAQDLPPRRVRQRLEGVVHVHERNSPN